MIIDRIWNSQADGTYFSFCTKSATKDFKTHWFRKSDFPKIAEFMRDNSDKDIYFCPHGFDSKERKKPFAVLPRLLWADLDEADPRTIKYKPTVAFESSPGRFVGLWFTDKPVTEELNRRMSYFFGADKSGWDLTQVLRVPGTTNYKYASSPKVRILWTDGPTYKVKDLERELPSEDDDGGDAGEETDAAAIYKKWEKKLPAWCRRELMRGKPTAGKRSEVFWKLGQTMIEAGLPMDDASVLLKASPWNKFRGRRNEDEQIERELNKAVNKHMHADKRVHREEKEDDSERGERRLIFRSMAEVEEEEIDWIWYPWLAFGELIIMEGDPGLGKSYAMQVISRCVCDGIKLPTEHKGEKPLKGKVLYFDLENSAGTVTKKRLKLNGLEDESSFIQCEEPFSIADDDALDEVYEYVERVRPSLVVFDTLNNYLGAADAFKGHEVAQVFQRFRDIARRFNCCVVVLRHLTKSSKEKALYRGTGSIQFSGLARVVITVGTSPEDADTRVMAVTKINIAKPPRALEFSIQSMPDKMRERDRSKFVWGDFVDLSSDDIVSAMPKKDNTDKEDAIAFLEVQLEDGAVEMGRLEKMAESRGISLRTLHRAADELGVIKRSKGFGKDKRAYWALTAGELREKE